MKKLKLCAVLALSILVALTFSISSLGDTIYSVDALTGTVLVSETGEGSSRYWCPPIHSSGCNWCGWCHAPSNDKFSRRNFDRKSEENHNNTYIPSQTLSVSEGQKLSLDNGKTVFIMESGQLVLYNKENKKLLISPRGSRVLKNKSGRPAGVLFNGSPTIIKK